MTLVDLETGEVLPALPDQNWWPAVRSMIDQRIDLALQSGDLAQIVDVRDQVRVLEGYVRQHTEVGVPARDLVVRRLGLERGAGGVLDGLERGQGNQYTKVDPETISGSSEYAAALDRIGFSDRTARMWQEEASLTEAAYQDWLAQVEEPTSAGLRAKARGEEDGAHVLSSRSNEWYTPAKYIEAARTVMTEIDMDPASSVKANQVVKAQRFFTIDDDGLAKDWAGRVWLNPPYGGLSGPFTAKLIEEYEAGAVLEAILLVNANSTDTAWFAPLWDHVLCFTDHRIDFQSPTGAKNNSTHGSVFVYLGRDCPRFFEHFGQFGAVVSRWVP